MDDDINDKPPVDEDDSNIAVLEVFDLALRKTLANGQPSTVAVGDKATFTLTVFNQGMVTATNVLVTDYWPAALQLADPAWTAGPNNTATVTLLGPIALGASASVNITVNVLKASTQSDYRNLDEISDGQDDGG